MKKIYFIFCLFLSQFSKAQYDDLNIKICSDSTVNKTNVVPKRSISGIICMDDSLYMVTERCSQFFRSILSSQRYDTCKNLDRKNMEIEGITAFKNKLYIVDELTGKVFCIDTFGLVEIEMIGSLPPSAKGNGIEGIAANELNNKFYFLLERDTNNAKARIYTYAVEFIVEKGKVIIQLNLEKTTAIPLATNWRYSDIYFDPVEKKLLLLKSYYDTQHQDSNQYQIEYISLDENSYPYIKSKAIYQGFTVQKLTKIIKDFERNGYSSNLEGIAIDKNRNLYLASDNAIGLANCIETTKDKTLILKIPLK